MNELVEVERLENDVVEIRLNDPSRRNAMTLAMGENFEMATRKVASDPSVRCVVVSGAPPAFCGGGDLGMLEEFGELSRTSDFDISSEMKKFYDRFLSIRDVPVPTIAAVAGHAIGAGLCLALACDLMVISTDAKTGLNFARLGLHPGMGGTWLLPRRVGSQRAAELLYTGRLLSGQEAATVGLALEALPTEEVLPRSREIATSIAQSSPLVVRQLKESLMRSERADLSEQLLLEASFQSHNYKSEDLDLGLAAARNKQSANFVGH